MRRIVVLGTSGAGKTTLARELARRLGVVHVELDAIHWKPNWTSTPTPRFIAEVGAALDAADAKADGWTVCGHYGQVRHVTWGRADTIIFLDYPMRVVFNRVLRRTLRRWWRQEELWNGNRERLRDNLFSQESLFLWVINTWRIRRRTTPRLLRQPQFAHLRTYRLRTPQDLERWLADGSRSGEKVAMSRALGVTS